MARESFSVRWHVAHSNVRTSIPRSPGEIRANPILCLQTGHIGRSTVEEEIRIAQHPSKTICASADFGLSGIRLSGKILAQFLMAREPGQRAGIVLSGHELERGRHGLGPESPLSPQAGVVLPGAALSFSGQAYDGINCLPVSSMSHENSGCDFPPAWCRTPRPGRRQMFPKIHW